MIALVSSTAGRASDPDLPVLTAALQRLGVGHRVVDWDDPSVHWEDYSTAVVRSTWDYASRLDEFLAWCRDANSRTHVWNSPDLVAWNVDKRYLLDLRVAQIPVVETSFVPPGGDVPELSLTGRVVVKPALGADASGAASFDGDAGSARRHVVGLLRDGLTAMIQPYAEEIDMVGETGLVYIGSELSHAFRKPALLDGAPAARDERGIMTYADRVIEPAVATAAERDLGDQTIEYVRDRFGPIAYARVDLVPVHGKPTLMELELVEPSLFLDLDREAPRRGALAFAALAGS